MGDDFLSQEIKTARSAIVKLVCQTGKRLQDDTSIRPLIEKRPLAALAAAAGGGLIAGFLLRPSRKQRRAAAVAASNAGHRESAGEMLQREVIHAVSPILRTFAASAAGSLFHSTNGHQPSATRPSSEWDDLPHQRIQI